MRIFMIVISLLLVMHPVKAQHFKIKKYNAGYRVFEIDAIGNNPLTIAGMLKDPVSYQRYIDHIYYNTIFGDVGIQHQKHFYLNVELGKTDPEAVFWKHYSIQAGLSISNKLIKEGMALQDFHRSTGTGTDTIFDNQYKPIQIQQFAGLNIGLNRRFRISNKIKFVTGFQVQGDFAMVHKYRQQLDSTIYISQTNHFTKTTMLADLKGKHFYQWQAMIPLAFEFDIYRNRVFARLEAMAGVIGGQYRRMKKEAHGMGIWLVYQPG